MSKRKAVGIVSAALVMLLGWLLLTNSGRRAQFLIGGVLVNFGYRMQDHLESYDFEHEHEISPDQVWSEV